MGSGCRSCVTYILYFINSKGCRSCVPSSAQAELAEQLVLEGAGSVQASTPDPIAEPPRDSMIAAADAEPQSQKTSVAGVAVTSDVKRCTTSGAKATEMRAASCVPWTGTDVDAAQILQA